MSFSLPRLVGLASVALALLSGCDTDYVVDTDETTPRPLIDSDTLTVTSRGSIQTDGLSPVTTDTGAGTFFPWIIGVVPAVDNSGRIAASGAGVVAIRGDGVTLTNRASGVISSQNGEAIRMSGVGYSPGAPPFIPAAYFPAATTIVNQGSIQSGPGYAAITLGDTDDTLVNSGAIRSGASTAVKMGGGDDQLTLQGRGVVQGTMDGGSHATGDTFRVQLSGVSPTKRAEIQALFDRLGTSGGYGSFNLRGNTFSFVDFENLILDTSAAGLYQDLTLTHNQRAIARYLDNLDLASNDLSALYAAIDASGNIGAALNQLSPEMYDIYPEIAYRNALYSGAALDRRLSFLRGVGSPNSDFATLFDADHGVQLADAGGNAGLPADKAKAGTLAADGRRWTAWALGFGIFADKDADTDVTGYHAQTGGALIGADYRLDRNFFVGLSAGYAHTSADIDNFNSSARADSYSFGGYAGYHNTDGIYADAMVNAGWDSFETRRFIGIPYFERQAHSEHDGTHVDARLGAGWMKKVGCSFTLGPTFALQYVHLGQSAIREHGAGDVSLRIEDRDTDSLASLLGFRAAARFTADGGKVEWNPELRARWVHEFTEGTRDITARFTGDSVGSFTVRTDGPRRDSAMVGVGVSATVSKRFTGYLQYDADLGGKGNVSHGIMGGLRVKF